MVISKKADAIIAKAKEAYALGLIDRRRLELVTGRALTDPTYSPILDLPLSHEMEEAR